MTGYSGTPLARKLGVKPGMRVAVVGRDDWHALVEPPEITQCALSDGELDLVHAFHDRAEDLRAAFPTYKAAIRKTGMLWVSWPKKASKVPTDLTGDVVRAIALDGGLVDVKVCAVDAVWSGLKMMWRVADR
ncbi:MAG: DUF3052 domain-containing protein [Deltaproteobacteria bacterium]|nr:MAG: DUF3052 domain-containing protein [Deltaproteobacteria bacterium]